MNIKQLSVFIENKQGRLTAIAEQLSNNNIDISALSLADTTEFGVLRMIVNDVEKAKDILTASGVIVKITDVIAVVMDDVPGGAAHILRLLSDNNLMIEYMYACAGKTMGKALMIVRVNNPELAQKVLDKEGYGNLKPSDIYRI